METMQGKHFSITDPDGVKTVIYQVNKTKKEYLNQYPKYTVERLDHTEEIVCLIVHGSVCFRSRQALLQQILF